jgi:hypothetical protein
MRHRLSSRSSIILFLLLTLICTTTFNVTGESALSWQALSVPGEFITLDAIAPNTPVTLRSQFRFTNQESIDSLEGLWFGGLSTRPDAPPTVLSVVWSEITAGWFPASGIQLQSAQGLFPGSLPVKQDNGFLAGSDYLNLLNHFLTVGQVIETQLSYDPRSGATALNILDLVSGKSLYSAEYVLKPYNGVLYPMLGIVTDKPGIIVDSYSAEPYSVPVGTRWSLLWQDNETQQYEQFYLTRVNYDSGMALQLGARESHEGYFEFTVGQGDAQQLVLKIPASATADKTVHPFQVKNLPLGSVVLNLQYVDPQGNTWLLGTNPLDVILGTVQVVFDPIAVQGKELQGSLRLTTEEGVVEQLRLHVTAHLKEYGRSESTSIVVLDQPLERLSTDVLSIPYFIPFDGDDKFYELTFTVDLGAPVSTLISGSRFYVLW